MKMEIFVHPWCHQRRFLAKWKGGKATAAISVLTCVFAGPLSHHGVESGSATTLPNSVFLSASLTP